MNTAGPGHPFNGVGQGTWEQGSYDYRSLPLPGSTVHHDPHAIASWSYDHHKKEMISFDDEQVAVWKANWINQLGLGGAMYWELSSDKGGTREEMEKGPGKDPQPGRSLISIVKEQFGKLDDSPNNLEYKSSKFDNLRNGIWFCSVDYLNSSCFELFTHIELGRVQMGIDGIIILDGTGYASNTKYLIGNVTLSQASNYSNDI